AAAAAEGSSDGCEFYLQPPHLLSLSAALHSCYAAYVVNTSAIQVELALEFEGNELDLSKSVYSTKASDGSLIQHHGALSPGEGAILFVSDQPDGPKGPLDTRIACPEGVVPALYRDYAPRGTQLGSSFHLRTNVPVSAAAIYPFGGAPSAFPSGTLLLPVAIWSKQNILINPWDGWQFLFPGVQILAAEDETDVTIVPRKAIQDGIGVIGSPAGVPATYRLHKGQFLQLAQQEELTGSFVTSTKPTSVVAAHSAAQIPTEVGYADLIGTQIPAYELWGSEYVGVGYRPRQGDEHEPMPYRIVAVRDGTRLDYDPEIPRGAPIELKAGEVATFASGVGEPFVVRTQDTEHPIWVGSYMTGAEGDYWLSGRNYKRRGDPELVNVIPTAQYLNRSGFYADPTYADTSLVIVRSKADDGQFKDVTLECLGGPVPGFRPVGTRGDYEFTRVDLAIDKKPGIQTAEHTCHYGAHRLQSDGPFTATLWGWDEVASYGFPSGMAARKLATAPLITK
ncbi:MAG: hypothetical protein K0S65_2243, partial [Labilithrix sp.]|nr:hypothetical protein [Labilithrix sp.]